MASINQQSDISPSWVQPAGPVQPTQFACSALENLCAHVYPTPTFFFHLLPHDDPIRHYQNLKRGLARVLYEMPHLTGKFTTDARGAFSVIIPEAPAAGVNFCYRDVSEDTTIPSFAQLAKTNFPFANGENDGLAKLRPNPFPASVDGDPVTILQLTRLNGGLVLMSSISHLVADLVQPNYFNGRWAAHTREVVEADLQGTPEPPLPNPVGPELVDRSQLSAKPSEIVTMEEVRRLSPLLTKWKLMDPENPQEMFETVTNLQPKARLLAHDVKDASSEEELRRTISGIWRFPADRLKALHSAVLDGATEGVKLSVIDVLTTFLWQRYFTAKYVPDEESNTRVPDTSRIIYAGDVRQRLNPPLPSGYLAAAVDLIHVEVPTTSIIPPVSVPQDPAHSSQESLHKCPVGLPSSMPADKLALIATQVRQANATWSLSDFNLLLRLSASTPTVPAFLPRGPFDLLVTDHTRGLWLSGANWGPGLGQPRTYREPYIGRTPPSGEITFLAKAINGDIEVMIAGEAVVMRRFAVDKELDRVGAELLWLMDKTH